jgi:hypothetical protein
VLIPLRTKELGTIESESKTIEEVKTVTEPFLILEENCAKEVKMIKKRSKKIKNLFIIDNYSITIIKIRTQK